MPDTAALTNAAQVIIRAGERLARLRVLDAPRKSVSVLASILLSDLQQRVAELRQELGIPADLTNSELRQELGGLDEDHPRAIAGTVEPPA